MGRKETNQTNIQYNTVSINRKYHTHTPQAKPQLPEEEPQIINSNNTSVRQYTSKATSFLFAFKIIDHKVYTELKQKTNVVNNILLSSSGAQW